MAPPRAPQPSPLGPGGGLYIHVPFCRTLCSYCNFVRTADHDTDLRARTVAACVAELALRRGKCASLSEGRRQLRTAYIGGGTPSALEPDLFTALLSGTVGKLPVAPDLELTVEANPESFSPAVVDAWRSAGVGRVSLGVQSLDADVLQRLGRQCDPATARGAIVLACRHFERVAADWIIGPGVQRRRLLAELTEAIGLGVGHVSLYILELHQGSDLSAAVAAGRVAMPSDARIETLYLAAVDRLAELGLRQYEVANFALPASESRHNRAYWSRRPYLGLGPGAHGLYGRWRYANTGDLSAYLASIEAGQLPPQSIDHLTPAARRLESVVLPLRTAAGVPLGLIPDRALDLPRGVRAGFWTIDSGRLRLTARGFLRIDAIEQALARGLG